jgi:hypothetical protein
MRDYRLTLKLSKPEISTRSLVSCENAEKEKRFSLTHLSVSYSRLIQRIYDVQNIRIPIRECDNYDAFGQKFIGMRLSTRADLELWPPDPESGNFLQSTIGPIKGGIQATFSLEITADVKIVCPMDGIYRNNFRSLIFVMKGGR